MKVAKALILISGLSGLALGGPVGPPGGAPILNQSFHQSNAQFNVDSGTLASQFRLPFLVPGLCTSTNSQGLVINIPCGGIAGASFLGVNQDAVNVTSPTFALNAKFPIIVTAVSGGTTAQFALDPSSVTLKGQNVLSLSSTLIPGTTFFVSSGTLNNLIAYAATFPNGLSSSGTILGSGAMQITGTSTLYGPVMSANYGYTMPDGSVLLSTSDYIWNNRAYQTGSSFNVSSGTYHTQLNLPFLTPGLCATTDTNGKVVNIACGNGGAFTSWYLKDISGGKWSVTLDTTGHLNSTAVSSIPTGALALHQLVTEDSSFSFWTISIDTGGHLITTNIGTNPQSVRDLLLNDATGIAWVITVDTFGHLVTQ